MIFVQVIIFLYVVSSLIPICRSETFLSIFVCLYILEIHISHFLWHGEIFLLPQPSLYLSVSEFQVETMPIHSSHLCLYTVFSAPLLFYISIRDQRSLLNVVTSSSFIWHISSKSLSSLSNQICQNQVLYALPVSETLLFLYSSHLLDIFT